MVKLYKVSYEDLAELTPDEEEILVLSCPEVDGRMVMDESVLVDMKDVAESENLVLRISFIERIEWMFDRQEANGLERKFDFVLDLAEENEDGED